jgi:hypothetical protein
MEISKITHSAVMRRESNKEQHDRRRAIIRRQTHQGICWGNVTSRETILQDSRLCNTQWRVMRTAEYSQRRNKKINYKGFFFGGTNDT